MRFLFGKLIRNCYGVLCHHRAMFARILLIFTLLVSLVFGGQARPVASEGVEKSMPGCALMTCVNGCCVKMDCCVRSVQNQGAPEQAPAAKDLSIELAAPDLRAFSIVHVLPAKEHHFVICKETQMAHTLPPLAATCIQLI
jgi:hypothetical protein